MHKTCYCTNFIKQICCLKYYDIEQIHNCPKYIISKCTSCSMQKIYIKDFKVRRLQCFSKLAVCFKLMAPASWSSGNAFVSGVGGLRFKSRTGQIEHSVTNDLPPLRHSSKRAVLPRAMTRRWAPPTRYTLRQITASIIKDLI